MRYRVRLTRKAEEDVSGVLEWFAAQAAIAAGTRWLARLLAAIDTLESMPERCGLAVEADAICREIRELQFGKRQGTYRILFEIRGMTVFILHIRHSAREPLRWEDL